MFLCFWRSILYGFNLKEIGETIDIFMVNVEMKMDQTLSFEKTANINEQVFRNEVWKSFYKALVRKKDFILDFRNVRFISSTVVTKLCCLGEIAKREGLDVKIIPSAKLAVYLAEIDFWHVAVANEIFSFDKRYLDIANPNKKVTNALFCIEKEQLKSKYIDAFEFAEWANERTKYKYWVRAELTGVSNAVDNAYYTTKSIPECCKAVLKTVSGFVGYSQYTSEDKMLSPIIELVHNAVWHSHGKCYFLVQTSTYGATRIGIDISVADTGCGLYRSLINKDENDDKLRLFEKNDFLKLTDKTEQNYCSIAEALFFREQSETRGLYDIITDLATEPRDYFCRLQLINGNVILNLLEGQNQDRNGEKYEMYDISRLVNQGISYIIENQQASFIKMSDIGFSFCIDMSITIPLKRK